MGNELGSFPITSPAISLPLTTTSKSLVMFMENETQDTYGEKGRWEETMKIWRRLLQLGCDDWTAIMDPET